MSAQARSLVSVCALASLALLGCSPGKPAAAPAEKPSAATAPVKVDIYRIAERQRAGVVRASGLIAYKNETPLSFAAPGVIQTIAVDDGARVTAGQVLATLRRTTTGADAAEAGLVRQTAQQTFDRVSRLFAAGAASQADLDNARLGLERARETLAITASASGVILRRDVDRGQTVQAGQPVFTLGEDRAGMIVRAQLSSVEVAKVNVGDAAGVVIKGHEPRQGTVSQISPKMVAGMGAFEVEIRLAETRDLKSGEVAEVQIATNALASPPGDQTPEVSVVIPAIALIDARADQGIVFILGDNNTAVRRAIRTEGLADGGVVVAGGLKPGEAIITRGASMVRDGDPVAVAPGQD